MIIGSIKLQRQFKRMVDVDLAVGIGRGILLVQEAAKSKCLSFTDELRSKILTDIEQDGDIIRGICWSVAAHGIYVEFGTGPKGQESHAGVSPNVAVAYRQSPWWIHESQIDAQTAEHYHFPYVDTPEGRFYRCVGQKAHPFLYPALKDNTKEIVDIIERSVRRQL